MFDSIWNTFNMFQIVNTFAFWFLFRNRRKNEEEKIKIQKICQTYKNIAPTASSLGAHAGTRF